MRGISMAARICAIATACALLAPRAGAAGPAFDIVFRDGLVVDGSGRPPYRGDVAIRGDRVAYVGLRAPGRGRQEVDARGRAVAPGFINMLSQSDLSLMADGRGLSDLRQGVTLEVMGEGVSAGPLTPAMREAAERRQGQAGIPITWTTLDDYLVTLQRRGVSVNVASFVGAATIRTAVLGEGDVQPTPEQLAAMRALARQAMQQGAMGVSTSLIYAPGTYARTDEIVALAGEAGRCGGLYISHMRSEGDRLLEAAAELIDISRRSGAPAEIFHLKASGRDNWGKLDALIAKIEAARASGLRITANMYPYAASSTGFDAAMPTWVQAGGIEEWIARLKDPSIRARVLTEMREAKDFESAYRHAGPEGTLLVAFRNPALRPLVGKTLAEVARARGVSPEDAIIDLVVADGSRVQVVYFAMNEALVARQVTLPWMSFGSDAGAMAPEGVFLQVSTHPRAYGAFARLLAKYVRDERRLSLAEAVRKLTSLPAHNLGLHDRGLLKVGDYADVVVFDPSTIQDHATYERPQQLATGVDHVVVNGVFALRDGVATPARPGQVVRGPGWTGWTGGGACPNVSSD